MENTKINKQTVIQTVMDDFKTHVFAFFLKAWLYFVYIGIGLIGVFAEKMRSGRSMNFWQVLSTGFIAIFVGYLASVYCYYHAMEQESAYIVPVVTLCSDKIFTSLLAVNWKGILNAIIDKLRGNNDSK